VQRQRETIGPAGNIRDKRKAGRRLPWPTDDNYYHQAAVFEELVENEEGKWGKELKCRKGVFMGAGVGGRGGS